jgi:hypothetical protein|tara:strand:+ start:651 stop:1160 length:510 start_codon:yes stop_codon:yes gene_type:complete
MEQNVNNKIELKDRLISFYNNNKLKIYVFFLTLIIILFSTVLFKVNKDKKNILIAEKYIEAGLYLASDKKNQSKNLYEEIILSKNSFYSILALNIILEKNLISDKKIILNYFKILEKIKNSKEQTDLIKFRKALYLIKINNTQEGKEILKNLIEEESALKQLVEEIMFE